MKILFILLAMVLGLFVANGCREGYWTKVDFNLAQYKEDELYCREQALDKCGRLEGVQYSRRCVRDNRDTCLQRKGYVYTHGYDHKTHGVK